VKIVGLIIIVLMVSACESQEMENGGDLRTQQHGNKKELAPQYPILWPPCTGKNDQEAATIPTGAKSYAAGAGEIRYGGSLVLSNSGNGIMLPIEKEFEINSGTFVSGIGTIQRKASFTDWAYIYKDQSRQEKVNWGPCLTQGEIVFPISIFENAPDNMFVENHFEAEDFGKKHILIRLNPAKDHRLCMIFARDGLHTTAGYMGTKMELAGKTVERGKDGWYQGEKLVIPVDVTKDRAANTKDRAANKRKCEDDCQRMYTAQELKKGMSVKKCVKIMCQ